MNQERIIELAKAAGFERLGHTDHDWVCYPEDIEAFAALVAAAERERISKMLNYLDMKAQPYHNYYKHAAVEINRKAGEGELI